jgi:DAK2 domain fusion protein YloV
VAAERSTRDLDGPLFRQLFEDASKLLHRHIEPLNAINVFPVPDGDTGTNMHLTLQAGVQGLTSDPDGVARAAEALARGALMGARGNSGVILSQVLRGLAYGLDRLQRADGAALVVAFRAASDAAYEALSQPREGTILTVVRQTAEALEQAAPEGVGGVLDEASVAARSAVERTPELLPVLKEAGVVDAGGMGFAVIVEGLRRSWHGDTLDVDITVGEGVEKDWRNELALSQERHAGETGYCTEFVVEGSGIDPSAVRARLGELGSSLLVVGSGDLWRVHVHTVQPDDALAYGRTLGEVSRVKVDNMEAQIRQFTGETTMPEPVTPAIDIVAVAAGEGVEATFRSVGVANLVQGGQTMNPSAGEILDAIEACPRDDVVVLPNNKNIVAAAEHAARESTKHVRVVPSRTLPQGFAAVLAVNADLTFDANVAAMERALTSVRSAEVTRAVRATTIDGQRIEMGQAIGIVDGELTVVADDVGEAARQCASRMLSPDASLLTMYRGEDVREGDAEALAESLRAAHPAIEVDLIYGGQPHYPYILSAE